MWSRLELCLLPSILLTAGAVDLMAGVDLPVTSTIIPLTNVPLDALCERAEAFMLRLSGAEVPGIVAGLDTEIAAEHLGVQQFAGEAYGINAIFPINRPVVAAAAKQSLEPMTEQERNQLAGQLNGQSYIPPEQSADSYQHIMQARALVEENASRSGWSNGDPNLTLYDGRLKERTPDQLVGQLIAGFDEFGMRITFYAGKIRKVFATESDYNGYWVWAELETTDREIITVPLSYGSRLAPFYVNGAPLVKGWSKS